MKQRMAGVAVIGGGVVLIAVLALVLAFGRKDPSPPSLVDEPEPSIQGQILYLSVDGCIIVADASGAERRELTCPVDATGVGWLDDGTVLYGTFAREPAWWVYDPETGDTEQIETGDPVYEVFGPPEPRSPVGENRATFDDEGSLLVLDPEPSVVYEYDGPSGYQPGLVTWSPDGEWILVHYSRDEELWIVARDGSVAGTIADDVRFTNNIASWRIEEVGVLPEVERPE